MNQATSLTEKSSSTEDVRPCEEMSNVAVPDAWEFLLATLLIGLQHWKLLIFGPLLVGGMAMAGSFLLPKSYLSYAYVGPLNTEMANKTSVLVVSPLVVDAAFRRIAKSFRSMSPEEGRRYLMQRIQFRALQGTDTKLSSLYAIELLDTEPSRAHDVLNAVIESWLAVMKPAPEMMAALQRKQEAFEAQSADASQAIALFLTHPELLKADTKTGGEPNNVADMIGLRTDGIVKSEDLKFSIAGLGRDIVVLPPIVPTESVGPSEYKVALLTGLIVFVTILLVVVFRGVLVPVLDRSKFGARYREIVGKVR